MRLVTSSKVALQASGRRLAVGLTVSLCASMGMAAAASAAYVTDPKSTWSANKVVFDVAVKGDTVYLGGKFTALSNADTGQTVPAGGLAALDRVTGELIWTATANGDVRSLAVSTDGTMVFAGGAFTTINGATENRLAALAPATGAPISSWQGSASGAVRDLVVSGSDLYAGGSFGRVNGARRGGLARLDVASGAVEPWKAPTAGGRPQALALSTDATSLIVGGTFTTLAGLPRTFLGSVSTVTGQATEWTPAPACGTCTVLDVDTDANATYVAATGPGGRLIAYTNAGGQEMWSQGADGNVQAVAVSNDGLVYAGGHFELNFGGQTRAQLAAVNATTGAVDAFAPQMLGNAFPGVWALTAQPDALFVGGGFTGVGSATKQARYAELPTG